MPTAVERAGIGVKAIIAVLEERRGDPPTELGNEFGGAIKAINFTMPAEFHFGQEVKEKLLLPAVHEELGLVGVGPFDDGLF